jgi:hypothetical protein
MVQYTMVRQDTAHSSAAAQFSAVPPRARLHTVQFPGSLTKHLPSLQVSQPSGHTQAPFLQIFGASQFSSCSGRSVGCPQHSLLNLGFCGNNESHVGVLSAAAVEIYMPGDSMQHFTVCCDPPTPLTSHACCWLSTLTTSKLCPIVSGTAVGRIYCRKTVLQYSPHTLYHTAQGQVPLWSSHISLVRPAKGCSCRCSCSPAPPGHVHS